MYEEVAWEKLKRIFYRCNRLQQSLYYKTPRNIHAQCVLHTAHPTENSLTAAHQFEEKHQVEEKHQFEVVKCIKFEYFIFKEK